MGGVLVIDKPKGMTSHDVVSTVKRRLRAKRVGHLGTLDPNATGVLVLVVDSATRLARFFEGGRKVYEAVIRFGEETDTFDAEGKVTQTRPIDGISEDDIKTALEKFVGRISQLPPMYSAVKKGGTPLYKLARKGITVEREAKEVEIYEIGVLDVSLPNVTITVSCSRGTYIRTLCHDVGEALGCGAHLFELRRTGSGPFEIERAVSLEAAREELKEAMISVDEAFEMVAPPVELDADARERIERGATLVGVKDFPTLKDGEMVRLLRQGFLEAIASYRGDGIFKIIKRFENTGRNRNEEDLPKVNVN